MLAALIACRSLPEFPPADLSQPGWTVLQGQALWKPKSASAPPPLEIAGELVVATRADGQTLLQFIKTPFPIVIAQTTSNLWRLEIPAEDRIVAGRGMPPARAAWLQLACAVTGRSLAGKWQFQRDASNWRLENPDTGEVVSGYFEANR
jgi:hypothetical protein